MSLVYGTVRRFYICAGHASRKVRHRAPRIKSALGFQPWDHARSLEKGATSFGRLNRPPTRCTRDKELYYVHYITLIELYWTNRDENELDRTENTFRPLFYRYCHVHVSPVVADDIPVIKLFRCRQTTYTFPLRLGNGMGIRNGIS